MQKSVCRNFVVMRDLQKCGRKPRLLPMHCWDPQPQSENTANMNTDDYLVKEMANQGEDDYSSDYNTVDLVVGITDQSFGERNTHLHLGSDTIINCWCRVWGCKTLFVDAKGIKYRWGKLDHNIHSLQVLQSSANNAKITDCAQTCSDFRLQHPLSILSPLCAMFLWITESQCFTSGRPS